MATRTIDIRDEGDKVVIITPNGIATGHVVKRTIHKDNVIKYSVKPITEGRNIIRQSDQVFDNVDKLLDFYRKKFNQ